LAVAADTYRSTYRITFDTDGYNADGFFPRVAIDFRITEVAQHYHVPLLLSPFGYSTYRGS
jgi:5-hydroxyisourate hydrolase